MTRPALRSRCFVSVPPMTTFHGRFFPLPWLRSARQSVRLLCLASRRSSSVTIQPSASVSSASRRRLRSVFSDVSSQTLTTDVPSAARSSSNVRRDFRRARSASPEISWEATSTAVRVSQSPTTMVRRPFAGISCQYGQRKGRPSMEAASGAQMRTVRESNHSVS